MSAAPPTFSALGRRHGSDADADRASRSGRRSLLFVGIALLALILAAVLLSRLSPDTSQEPLSASNPDPVGARAAAQILGEHGVQVTEVSTTAAALADARPEATLLITGADELRPEQLRALADVPSDVVLIGLGYGDLSALTDRVQVEGGGAQGTYPAECSDEHAQAAEELSTAGPGLATHPDMEGCFPLDDTAGTVAFGTWTAQDGQTWSVLANPHPLTNAGLDEAGNAALVLRILGQHEHLTWYVPDPNDDFGMSEEGPSSLIPGMVAVQVLITLVAFAYWRGRRLGRVVVEPLPVVVRATETTRGRGRLYRRGRSYAHAAAALRAGTISRIAARLGLPRTATGPDVVEALSRATGRPPEAIDSLLYGPPPTDDASLITLTQALDILESEVHR
ncbi:MAG TPA: DUF4350 domain-containing protein [Candidatus Ruania gallistercoris]|uniref:DUF4350 domain-containing protein n=1 Tax=Candidatus Ruania gallistercoris TaxID=2838746 RepID=A0A9D2EFC6_9MICO|nr:DUF4350 domain-containing protein [Candidatus Ruania gallistercoris]